MWSGTTRYEARDCRNDYGSYRGEDPSHMIRRLPRMFAQTTLLSTIVVLCITDTTVSGRTDVLLKTVLVGLLLGSILTVLYWVVQDRAVRRQKANPSGADYELRQSRVGVVATSSDG